MASILTNASATSALQTLRSISNDMSTTQERISSGARVGSASDNASYWSIATTMRSDNAALEAVSDALGMGAAKVDTAYAGVEAAIDVVKTLNKKIVSAKEPSADKEKIQEEITQLKSQLVSIVSSASFNGENWLRGDGSGENATVVTGFVRTDGAVSVKTETYDATSNALFDSISEDGEASGGILGTINGEDWTVVDADEDTLNTMLADVEEALQGLSTAGSQLGSLSTRIELQDEFVTNLSDSITKGIGRLVDADMNEESTRLKALQTQQQLAIQALSIANSDSQNILSLFR